jgi:uncharacterized protein (TIGR02246 family)
VRTFFQFMTAAAVALSFLLAPPAPAEAGKERAADEAALRKLVAEQTDAWNRSDAAAWCKDFAPDATFTNILGVVLDGRPEIEKRHTFIFDNLFKGSRTQVTVTRVLFVDDAVAVVDTDHVVTGYTRLPPGIQPTEPGMLKTRMRFVMKKTGKTWQIVAGQNTDVKPVPAAAPTKEAPAGK